MGLDMYLYAERYNIGGWDYQALDEKSRFDEMVLKPLGLERSVLKELNGGSFSSYTNVCIGYWRKANAIHGWFVKQCQDGVDECQKSLVSRDDLKELLTICKKSLADKEAKLEPTKGFFFGAYDIDEWYWRDIEHTIKVCEFALSLDNQFEFYYQSSW